MKNNFLLFLTLSFLAILSSCEGDNINGLSANNGGQSGSITRFAIHQGYMYSLNPNELLTYSLKDEDNPELVNTLKTDYGLETIFIYDDAIFLGSTTSLYILDISTPEAPILLSQTARSVSFFGGCDPVVVKENHAYSTVKVIENVCGDFNSRSALLVYDISNRNFPLEVGNFDLGEPNGLGIKDDYLVVCDAGTDEVRIFNISNPEDVIALEGNHINIENPVDLIINGNNMIVSAQTEFEIYNISDINQIVKTGAIEK